MATTSSKIYQFKLTLAGSKPPIWRRIQIPENYSFWQLHFAIQDSMGWEDYHLHQFTMSNSRTGLRIGESAELDDSDMVNERKTKISKYFSTSNNKAMYEYDFGDGWEHQILLEKIIQADNEVEYPICLAGKRACPPEDCGGIWGYMDLLEIINNPNHPDYEERMEWLGDEFDPEDFKPEDVVFIDRKERLL